MKTKLKLPIVVAIAAMCAALAFTLTACATPEKLAKKLAEKDSTYTATMTMTMTNAGVDTSYTQDFRISGKQFHGKVTIGSEAQYSSIIQEGEKYYKIEGTDEELVKTEISKELFDEANESTLEPINVFKTAIADFNTYFEKSGESYKLKADQKLAFLKITDPEMTELPDENTEYLDTIELKFEDDKITLTYGTEDILVTLVFSEIGTTKFEPFTDKVPTAA